MATTETSVKYGPWDIAEDVAPILYPSSVDGQPLLRHAMRRKVFEFWHDADGQKMVRWTWEYSA